MRTWLNTKKELLQDPEFANGYEGLARRYKIASQLIGLRIKKGLSQTELATLMGTRQSAIARLESGDYNPSLKLLDKIAHATGSNLEIYFK